MQDSISKEGFTFIWVKDSSAKNLPLFATLKNYYEIYIHELRGYTDFPIPYELVAPEDNQSVYYILIRKDNADIGFIFFSVYPSSLSLHDIHVDALYIYHHYRRLGYAKTILSLLVSAAEYENYDITYKMLTNNIPARNLTETVFENMGYEDRFGANEISARISKRKDYKYYYFIKVKGTDTPSGGNNDENGDHS